MTDQGLRQTGSLDLYGIVASYPYPLDWKSGAGHEYTFWMVDLAFPVSGEDSNQWFTIPFIIWIDYQGKDPRIANNLFYSVTHSGYASSKSAWDYAMQVISVHFYQGEPVNVKFVDTDVYFEARNQALSPFEPGLGLYTPFLSFPDDVSYPEQLKSFHINETPPGSNPISRRYFLRKSLLEEWNLITLSCFAAPQDRQRSLYKHRCNFDTQSQTYGGILGSVQFIDKDW